MTDEETRTKLFNLRYQEKILQMQGAHETNPEAKREYEEQLANVREELKILRKQIAKMKLEQMMEEKQGGMKR